VGAFIIDGFIAQGGMGRVYTARHREIGIHRVAVKVLVDTTKEADRAAFRKEAEAAAGVKSVNIVALHDFGFTPEGAPYLVMELLQGQTLEGHIRALGSVPYMEALALAQQVLAALGAIHSSGLVHRDIKPANLFLVNDASQGVVVKVMDLGLAAGRPKVHQDTGVGTEKEENRAGTPVYASPEQFGDLVVGPASDVYSLGVVLYELVTGSVPFPERAGDSESTLPRRHLREKPKHPGVFVPDLPEPVASFMLSLLEKEPLKRPTVAAAQNQVMRLRERFRDRLREGPTQIKANPLEPPARNTDQLPPRLSTEEALVGMRRDRRPMLVVATVGVLLLLGLGIAVRMQPDERGEATGERVEATAQAPATPQTPQEAATAVPTPTPIPATAELPVPSLPGAPNTAASAEGPRKESPEDELAELPVRAVSRLPPASKPAHEPRARASSAAPAECVFDARYKESARREWATLRELVSASRPEAQRAEASLRAGFAAEDCQLVSEALEKLAASARGAAP
jgi:serine/threonine-protein kinase